MKSTRYRHNRDAAGLAIPAASAARATTARATTASGTATSKAVRRLQGISVLLLLLAAGGPARAHELQESRATLVQRDSTFVAMTLYIDLPAAMHRALAPTRPFAAFAAEQASLPPNAFKAALQQTAGRMQSEMRVTTAKGTALTFERWTWPDATRVQAAWRERLMEAVVAPGEHAHAQPLEVRAELHSAQPISALRIKFAPAVGRVMVVSYRPRQVWVGARSLSPDIRF